MLSLQFYPLVLTALSKISNCRSVHWEEPNRCPVFRAHVGDGGAVSQRQLLHTRPVELHEFPYNTNLPQMLKQGQYGLFKICFYVLCYILRRDMTRKYLLHKFLQ